MSDLYASECLYTPHCSAVVPQTERQRNRETQRETERETETDRDTERARESLGVCPCKPTSNSQTLNIPASATFLLPSTAWIIILSCAPPNRAKVEQGQTTTIILIITYIYKAPFLTTAHSAFQLFTNLQLTQNTQVSWAN